MAGLAHDAAHFFKFLFILVLYTLAMTLYVSVDFTCIVLLHRFTCMHPVELPLGMLVHERGHSNLAERVVSIIPDDLRRILRSLERYSSRLTLATVVMPPQIHLGGAFR